MPSGRSWNDALAGSTVDFFLGAIGGHDRVASLRKESTNVFVITRTGSLSDVRVWVCDVYTLGLADYMKITAIDPDLDAVVTMSGYNKWTREAKEKGYEDEVGVYKFGEFMGALNYDGHDFIHYKTRART